MPVESTALWRTLRDRRHLFLIAGPCVIESKALCLQIGRRLQTLCHKLGIPFVFKASYDKANRTSARSFRGPGLQAGLAILSHVRERLGVPVLTDIHSVEDVSAAGEVADILQIPAFLCRQTDLLQAAVKTGRIVNVKKGQFLAPGDMANVVTKAVEVAPERRPRLLLTERGTTFGYHNLVVDMRSLPIMSALGYPVVFDATHSVQLPGGAGDHSGGQREFAPVLARSAVVAGADGLFIETHPDPDHALSDGPNLIPLAQMPQLLAQLVRLKEAL
ncbi:MAG TPA: 3-deoxy-8-phosphooctulonate synthase [Verrucomicrobiota bacterium]|nr:3-deoxy-8-phosphooctulonate synthase [Verrucomicrobiota bacterium]